MNNNTNPIKNLKIALCIMVIVVFSAVLVACGTLGKNKEDATPASYTIQYTDENGMHTISVQDGTLYSIETIPQKEGYTFLGLFDAKVGGTQYIDDTGISLSSFKDKKNIVLFAQYVPKQYKIVLDYQGASVTGSRQLLVEYGADLPELPKNLSLEHKDFCGWYTQPDCEGKQIADQYSNIPLVSVLNGNNFDLSAEAITLYAGFSAQKYNVTFWADDKSQEMEVAYNTPINEVVPEFRKDGKAVISWSKVQNDTALTAVFTGKVTADLVLYAAEWAPIIELDANGGKDVSAIIAKEGSAISLPNPVRTDYTFAGWYTKGGVEFTAKTMPVESQKLTAKWNPQLIFSTNGGAAVENISEPVGTRITLPTTEKDSYIFAGWYTADGTQYTATSMPQDSVKLMAKYYKIQTETINIIPTDKAYAMQWKGYSSNAASSFPTLNESKTIDLSKLPIRDGVIHIKAFLKIRGEDLSITTVRRVSIDFYNNSIVSDSYLLSRHEFSVSTSDYFQYDFEANWNHTKTAYACFYLPEGNVDTLRATRFIYIADLYFLVEYPDMTTLY